MFCFLQVFCILFSCVLLAAGIPNELYKYGNPALGLISLIPFYIAISRAKSYRQAFWLSFFHGGIVHLFSSFWLGNFHGMAAFTLGASLMGTAFIEGYTGWLIYFPFSKKNSSYSSSLKIFWFAGTWIIYEWVKSTGFLAYPWGTVSMCAWKWSWIIQIADITGPYGVSFLFALFSALAGQGILQLFEDFSTDSVKKAFDFNIAAKCTSVLFALTLCYGIYQYNLPRNVIKHLNTVLVQQNMDTFKANEEEAITISQELTEAGLEDLKASGFKADLVVWSEGVLGKYFPNSQHYYDYFPESRPLMKFIKSKKTPFIIGGALTIDRDSHKYSNCAALIDKTGQYRGAYSKIHLVPFAEAIPFVEYEQVRAFIKKIAGFSYGWTSGKLHTLFEIPVSENEKDFSGTQIISLKDEKKLTAQTTVKVSAPICFDDAFGHVCRGLHIAGSEVFMNITNDSWSKTESAEYQHFAVAMYRAIEYRTTLARCTNSGFTAVVGPQGKVLNSLPLFHAGSLAVSIPIYEHKITFVTIWGDWLPHVSIVLSLFTIIYMLNSERKSKVTEISVELVKTRRRRISRPKKTL